MIRGIVARIDPSKARNDYDPIFILSLVLDIGEEMLTAGAEINRVEDSIYRILCSYGYEKVNVFAITEHISVSFLDSNGQVVSEARRIYYFSNDMNHLEDLNQLSRYICANQPGITEIRDRLESKKKKKNSNNQFLACLAYFMGAGGFAIFFDGTIMDGIVSGLVVIFMYAISRISKVGLLNKIIFTSLSATLAGFAACILVHFGIGDHLDTIIIGNIMLLVPGLAFTTSLRDMLSGDIIAGLLRMIESIMVAAAIAIGYAVPLLLLGGWVS